MGFGWSYQTLFGQINVVTHCLMFFPTNGCWKQNFLLRPSCLLRTGFVSFCSVWSKLSDDFLAEEIKWIVKWMFRKGVFCLLACSHMPVYDQSSIWWEFGCTNEKNWKENIQNSWTWKSTFHVVYQGNLCLPCYHFS